MFGTSGYGSRVVRRVVEALTGEAMPVDEPLEITRAMAGMQVYRVDPDEQVQQQIDALPAGALTFGRAHEVLAA